MEEEVPWFGNYFMRQELAIRLSAIAQKVLGKNMRLSVKNKIQLKQNRTLQDDVKPKYTSKSNQKLRIRKWGVLG